MGGVGEAGHQGDLRDRQRLDMCTVCAVIEGIFREVEWIISKAEKGVWYLSTYWAIGQGIMVGVMSVINATPHDLCDMNSWPR